MGCTVGLSSVIVLTTAPAVLPSPSLRSSTLVMSATDSPANNRLLMGLLTVMSGAPYSKKLKEGVCS